MLIRFKIAAYKIVQTIKRHPHLVILIAFFLLHVFIFRGVATHIPEIIKGNEVLAREELIPFFNFKTQFFDQLLGGISPLTGATEVRISYSFLTAWVRYYAILPFAIIALPSISAFLLYFAFYHAVKAISREDKDSFIILSSLVGSVFIHLILLQSKVTHFYTLQFGFSLFALSLTLAIKFFIEGPSFQKKNIWILSLLLLLNPGIHYHFLFLFLFAPLFVYFLAVNRSDASYIKHVIINSLFVISLSTIPYVLLILYVTTHSGNISDAIPLGYTAIYYSSVSLGHLFSFDIASPYSMFSQGSYLPSSPDFLKMSFLLTLFGNILGYKTWIKKNLRPLIGVILTAFLGAWFSLGYLYSWSAHSFLSFLIRHTKNIGLIGDAVRFVITNFLHVLRYPHRFEFIYFYAVGVLAVCGVFFGAVFFEKKYIRYYFLVFVAVFSSFLILPSYKRSLWSGNFGGFFEVYPISKDLKNIKTILQNEPGLSLVLPTFESGRVIAKTQFNFLDKFLIYYFDTPFLYYGTASNTESRYKVFLAYQTMLDGSKWWDKYLKNILNIDYIVVPDTDGRLKGQVFLPQVDDYIQRQLSTSLAYKVIYDGSDFDLYRKIDFSSSTKMVDRSLLLDMSHSALGDAVSKNDFLSTRIYLPLNTIQFVESSYKVKQVYTDRPKTAYVDLVDKIFPNIVRYKPDASQAPFDNSYTLSSDFSSTPLSLFTLLYKKKDRSNLVVKDLINLTTSSFLVTNRNPIVFDKVNIPSGDSFILVKAVSSNDKLTAFVGDKIAMLERLEQSVDKEEFGYYVGKVNLEYEKIETIGIQSTTYGDVLAVESLVLIPKEYYFGNLPSSQIGSSFLRLSPQVTKNLFSIYTKCNSVSVCIVSSER